MTVTEVAPAKVNLLLRVLEREPSGFHGLETLFCALEIGDVVTVAVDRGGTAEIGLEVIGADLGPPASNLAWRAAEAFFREAGERRPTRIRLEKRIPPGGGLGGGSSDAAAVLRALAGLLPGRVDEDRLAGVAAELGSDVPFFLAGAALAWGRGRGERITPLPKLEPRCVLLVLPPFPVATADAYRWLDADRESGGTAGAPPPAVSSGSPGAIDPAPAPGWAEIARRARNDFETVVFGRFPTLARARDVLSRHGAAPALLAGSGSTVFGVFENDADATAARQALEQEDTELRVVATRTR